MHIIKQCTGIFVASGNKYAGALLYKFLLTAQQ
jgi:hypothetical protein